MKSQEIDYNPKKRIYQKAVGSMCFIFSIVLAIISLSLNMDNMGYKEILFFLLGVASLVGSVFLTFNFKVRVLRTIGTYILLFVPVLAFYFSFFFGKGEDFFYVALVGTLFLAFSAIPNCLVLVTFLMPDKKPQQDQTEMYNPYKKRLLQGAGIVAIAVYLTFMIGMFIYICVQNFITNLNPNAYVDYPSVFMVLFNYLLLFLILPICIVKKVNNGKQVKNWIINFFIVISFLSAQFVSFGLMFAALSQKDYVTPDEYKELTIKRKYIYYDGKYTDEPLKVDPNKYINPPQN